jgi:hypothetical protein
MRGFREVGWVIAVAGTTLGCYMVNLRVATERTALEEVSNQIVLAQRDIRVLQTEIGTRGRLEQLESWNVRVLALSAPQAHQFLEGGYQLASLTAPKKTIDPAAPVVLATAPAPSQQAERKEEARSARDMMYVASLEREVPGPAPAKAVVKKDDPAGTVVKAAAKPTPPSKDQAVAKAAAPIKEASAKPKAAAPAKVKPAPAAPAKKSKDVQVKR